MPPAADTSGVIKGWQPTILDNPKLLPVLNEAGEHVAYAPAPAPDPVQSLVKAAKGVVERHQQSTNPFLQDDENIFETAAHAQKVPHFAETLHKGDISAADMEKASDLGWDLATKKTNETFPGSNHGIPSKASRELIIEQMKALEKANGKPTKIVPRVPESGPLATNPKATSYRPGIATRNGGNHENLTRLALFASRPGSDPGSLRSVSLDHGPDYSAA